MAFMAVLESDLRALSAEARRRYPAVKDGAEHAILKVTAPIHINSHVHTYMCVYIYIFVFICICMYAWISKCMHVCRLVKMLFV